VSKAGIDSAFLKKSAKKKRILQKKGRTVA
jgi:hypothetical protein